MSVTPSKVTALVNALTSKFAAINHTHSGYQETLVSGSNIKTVNNNSLLGSGNISVGGGSSVDIVTNWESTLSDSKVASEKLVKNTLDTKINNSILLEPTQENPIDLNDYTETGFYCQINNDASAYVSHMPTNDNRAFSLLVEKQTGVKQTLTYYEYQSKPRTFIRELHWGGSTWFDWYEISFTEDLNGKADLSHTHGNLSNDGKISTTSSATMLYFTGVGASANTLYKSNKLSSDVLIDGTAHSNIGSSANDSQSTINAKIDTLIGQAISYINQQEMVKND